MKKIHYAIILLLIIAVSVASYLVYNHSDKTALKSDTTESKQGFKTYTSNGGDFSVDYPSSWSTKFDYPKSPDLLQGVSLTDSANTHLIGIAMKSSTKSAKEALLSLGNTPNTTIDEQGEVPIAGRQGFYIIKTTRYPKKDESMTDRSYAVKDGDTLFMISFGEYSNVSYDGLLKPYDNRKYVDDFSNLVKSFRINR